MSDTLLLRLRHITRSYGERSVLRGVDLDIHRGQMIGIRGRSGSGKSTLARILVGLDTGFSGERLVGDHGSRRCAHLVFQDSMQSLNPHVALKWSLTEAAVAPGSLWDVVRGSRRSEGKIADALTEVGLSQHLLDVKPSQLSGGQRQRAALARALLSGARLLVFDEPVASLDPSVQARILNLLVRIRADRGPAMVVISHDHAVLEYLCDTVYDLDGGTLCVR